MRTFDFDGTACPVDVPALEVGDSAPDFGLLDTSFAEVTLAQYHGQRKVVLSVPGVDIEGPAQAARAVAVMLAEADALLLLVSRDTPLALARFVADNHLGHVAALSGFRNEHFGRVYGVEITAGRYLALYSTTLFVIDENDTIAHQQFVNTLNTQPDLSALAANLGLDLPEAT